MVAVLADDAHSVDEKHERGEVHGHSWQAAVVDIPDIELEDSEPVEVAAAQQAVEVDNCTVVDP